MDPDGAGGLPQLPDVADAVLEVVDTVPAGRVVTYGDVGRVIGSGPRQVGTMLARYGAMTAWWRVVRADGRPPQGHEQQALERYREEGTPLAGSYLDRVDLERARFTLG